MRSSAAQILETALALQRSPGERFRLRERPLPPGVIHLIEVAAGSPQALQAASAELGEPESMLLEAARFYLEQVLFADPDADAYRVLGLGPDVPHDTIRLHQRWLQRWLHPDRAQAGDASVFATRVNQAFAQLRSAESRHAYDVRLAEARLASAAAPLDPGTVRHWEHEETVPRYGQRSRWLLAAALVSCVVLAVLIVRNPEKSAAWDPDGDAGAAADRQNPGPAIEDRDLGVLSAALAVPPAPEVPEEASAAANQDAATSAPAEPVPVAEMRSPLAPAVAMPHGRSIATPAPVFAEAIAPVPASRRADVSGGVVSAASTVSAAPSSVTATPPTAKTPPVPPERTASAAPRIVAGVEDPVVMFNRMRQAEQRVAQVAAYLAAKPGAAPMWNDPQTEAEAARLRTQLNARKGSQLELTRPSWRLQADDASLSADYRCRSAGSDPCQGRLDVKLIWREGLWLVRNVGLVPSA